MNNAILAEIAEMIQAREVVRLGPLKKTELKKLVKLLRSANA